MLDSKKIKKIFNFTKDLYNTQTILKFECCIHTTDLKKISSTNWVKTDINDEIEIDEYIHDLFNYNDSKETKIKCDYFSLILSIQDELNDNYEFDMELRLDLDTYEKSKSSIRKNFLIITSTINDYSIKDLSSNNLSKDIFQLEHAKKILSDIECGNYYIAEELIQIMVEE